MTVVVCLVGLELEVSMLGNRSAFNVTIVAAEQVEMLDTALLTASASARGEAIREILNG